MYTQNHLSITGNIAANLELINSKSKNENVYCFFRVAVTRHREGKEYTDFIPCQAWGKVAANIVKYVKKGDQIIIGGWLSAKSWQDDSSNWHERVNVQVSGFQFGRVAKANANANANDTEIPVPF